MQGRGQRFGEVCPNRGWRFQPKSQFKATVKFNFAVCLALLWGEISLAVGSWGCKIRPFAADLCCNHFQQYTVLLRSNKKQYLYKRLNRCGVLEEMYF